MLMAVGIAELVQELQRRKTAVYLVSGGFRPIINPIAETLQIPVDHVYANTILHDVRPDLLVVSKRVDVISCLSILC